MTKRNRREEYWRFYDHAAVAEPAHLRRMLIQLIREKPYPQSEGSNRGWPSVHSKEKLDFACLWMMVYNQTYRQTESDLDGMCIVLAIKNGKTHDGPEGIDRPSFPRLPCQGRYW